MFSFWVLSSLYCGACNSHSGLCSTAVEYYRSTRVAVMICILSSFHFIQWIIRSISSLSSIYIFIVRLYVWGTGKTHGLLKWSWEATEGVWLCDLLAFLCIGILVYIFVEELSRFDSAVVYTSHTHNLTNESLTAFLLNLSAHS